MTPVLGPASAPSPFDSGPLVDGVDEKLRKLSDIAVRHWRVQLLDRLQRYRHRVLMVQGGGRPDIMGWPECDW